MTDMIKLIEAYNVVYDIKDENLANDAIRMAAYETLSWMAFLMETLAVEVPARRDGDGRT